MPEPLVLTLDSDELLTALDMNVEIKQPSMVWGPPGIGKSEIMLQLSKKRGIALKDVRAMLLNPVDVNGLPHKRFSSEAQMKLHRLSQILAAEVVDLAAVREIINPQTAEERLNAAIQLVGTGKFKDWDKLRVVVGDSSDDYYGETVWSRPGILPRVGRGILFFDELVSASEDTQAALYQPFLDHKIGEHFLGLGWVIMAAGNRIPDKGRVRPMPSPLSDRLQHYELAVKFEPWKAWAGNNDVHPMVIAYVEMSMRKNYADGLEGCGMLHRFNPKERSFPTPRSWVKVSNALKAMEDRNLIGTQIEVATIAGKVGQNAAVELIEFSGTFREGLTMHGIVSDPDNTKIPSKAAMRCAVSAALARIATKDNIGKLWLYVQRMPEEYHLLFFKHAATLNESIKETRVFTDFAVENAEFMA